MTLILHRFHVCDHLEKGQLGHGDKILRYRPIVVTDLSNYGYILFVHYSKWRDKLPSRPALYNYVVAIFVITRIALFGCGLAACGLGFGFWVYSFVVICYHTLFLPFVYVTFLSDFFQEEDLLLDNAYYSEMTDAGFFDADWEYMMVSHQLCKLGSGQFGKR